MKRNPLYSNEPGEWTTLLIQEQLEAIRKHLCTGPGGQSSQAAQQRSRIDAALKAAIAYLNQSTGMGS